MGELKWKGNATSAVPVGMIFGPSTGGKYHEVASVKYDKKQDLTIAKMKEIK